MEEKLLPQEESFLGLLIKPHDISKYDFRSPDYKGILMNLDIYESVKLSPENLGNELYEKLEMFDYSQVTVNSLGIWETEKYLYEMVHLDLPLNYHPVEIYNGMGNLLKTEHTHIFGNLILVKSEINIYDENIKMIDCTKEDLEMLLTSRVRHYGVRMDLDNEIEEFEFWYDPDKVLKEFFPDGKSFVEDIFLKHNLQIYYTKGNNPILEKIIGCKIEQFLILTKITDHFYGDIRLNEVNKILKLLKTECPKEVPSEWLEEKKDKHNRNIIINKYRILEKAIKNYS